VAEGAKLLLVLLFCPLVELSRQCLPIFCPAAVDLRSKSW
jgi:hypothetical protein